MKVDLLGVKIDNISKSEALARIEKWIRNPGKYYVVTPNPEFIVAANKDEVFKNILNKADLAIPDGVGLKFSGKITNTVPGIDLMESLIKLSAEKGFVIGFLGGREGVAEKCAECLKKKYPGLKVAFAESGGKIDSEKGGEKIKIPPLDILFVAFGQIRQEKWISKNQDKIPVKILMGVGGAFDYLSGRVPRAPLWVRRLGFEWLFRLITQPRRIKRQFSLIKYLWLLRT